MRIHRSPTRRTRRVIAAAGLVAGAVLVAPAAQAATAATLDPSAVATTLEQQLGSRTAGSYIDRSTGKLVVTVADSAGAQTVRSAGAVPKVVSRSGAELQQVTATLDRSARIPGTAWAVDPATNQVLVSVDETVTGAKLAKVQAAVGKLGGAARMERAAGTFNRLITGGDAIFGGGARCSLGFNVRSGNTFFFLTAGHCGNIASSWTDSSGVTLGPTTGSSFPNNDYAIVRYNASYTNHPGTVGSRDITGAANATVGQSVQRRGSTTGTHSGTVQATGVTVTFGSGETVRGMIQTTVCAEPGDSGGPLYSGNTALGLTSGGSGNCTFGGTTFYQPVTEALSAFGVSVF